MATTSNVNPCPPDITISGVPNTISDSPYVIAEKVFAALGIGELVSDILEARFLTKKIDASVIPRAVVSNQQGQENNIIRKTLIVNLKSHRVRDFIIDKRRAKKELTIHDVFGLDTRGRVFVNEFLPSALYALYRLTKTRAAIKGYKHVWTRAGSIFVRKDVGHDKICIRSEIELDRLA